MNTSHDDNVLERWHGGDDGVQIAAAIGIGSTTVYRILKRHGIIPSLAKRRPKNDWRRRHTAIQEEEILQRYGNGECLRAIARDMNCHPATITNVVKRNKITVRAVGGSRRRWTETEKALLLNLYRQGLSQEKIALQVGVTQAQISQMLRRLTGNQVRRALRKGGRYLTSSGYVMVKIDAADSMASMANNGFYLMEHRLNMARSLGRPLTRHETVHHINGDRQDNRIENLQLRKGGHGKGVVHICGDCGSRNVIHEAIANCN